MNEKNLKKKFKFLLNNINLLTWHIDNGAIYYNELDEYLFNNNEKEDYLFNKKNLEFEINVKAYYCCNELPKIHDSEISKLADLKNIFDVIKENIIEENNANLDKVNTYKKYEEMLYLSIDKYIKINNIDNVIEYLLDRYYKISELKEYYDKKKQDKNSKNDEEKISTNVFDISKRSKTLKK